MSDPVRIIGSYLSPYVRKVLVCLDQKGIPYQIDPIIPFCGDNVEGHASFKVTNPRTGQPAQAQQTIKGRRVGDCTPAK